MALINANITDGNNAFSSNKKEKHPTLSQYFVLPNASWFLDENQLCGHDASKACLITFGQVRTSR